jgi:hypothetical protein
MSGLKKSIRQCIKLNRNVTGHKETIYSSIWLSTTKKKEGFRMSISITEKLAYLKELERLNEKIKEDPFSSIEKERRVDILLLLKREGISIYKGKKK